MNGTKVGLIGGSGLGAVLNTHGAEKRHEVDTPFGRPSDAIIETQWDGLPLLLLSRHGPGHLLHPSQIPYRANIFALKQLGCTHILASGAVGSLRDELKPRDLVIPDQIIDRTNGRKATFFEKAAVHVELAEPFCPVLRQIVVEAGKKLMASEKPGATAGGGQFSIHDRGCYVCMEGPAFSTRAESLMHRLMGGDLIGMTALPEAKLAREAEISYAMVALVTDYDCWRSKPGATTGAPSSKAEVLKEIIGNLQAATENALRLLRESVAMLAQAGEKLADWPAHHALELAIWSDKSQIPASEVQRLAPLWIKYFGRSSSGKQGDGDRK